MLRYRVAFDPERGHFVLPVFSAIIAHEETFASRAVAQEIAQSRNSRNQREAVQNASPVEADFLETFLRRASA